MKALSAMVRDIPEAHVGKLCGRHLSRDHTAGYLAIAIDRIFSENRDRLKEIISHGPADQNMGDQRKTLQNLYFLMASGEGLKDS